MSWSSVNLGELETRGELIFRNGFSSGEHEKDGDGVPHLRPFNVTDDCRVTLATVKTIATRDRLEGYSLRPGDVLFNNTNSEDLVGKCAPWYRADGTFVLSNHMTIIRMLGGETLDPGFLAFWLFWNWRFGSASTLVRRHVNQASIGLDRLRSLSVPRPPTDHQRAIAEVLSKVQSAVEAQEKIVAGLRELKAVTMAKLFREGLRGERRKQTEIGEIPRSWETRPLSACAVVQTGIAKGRKVEGGDSAELPYLRVANVQDGYLDLSEIKTIVIRSDEVQRYLLQAGDVLLTEGGDFDKLGRGYIWKGQIADCVHQNHIFAVRTDEQVLLPEFFAYQAQSPYGKTYFLKVAHKTTNLACINSSKLKEFPVLLPDLKEQRQIAHVLESIAAKADIELQRLGRLRSLFSSTLHLLMTGQVRVAVGKGA